MTIQIKVGVIGPLWIKNSLQKSFNRFPSLTPVFRLSDDLTNADIFTQELACQVDCFLYSGRVPYLKAKKSIPSQIPAFYIPLKGSGLYRALYLLKQKKDWNHISFDGIQASLIDAIQQELPEPLSYTIHSEKENKEAVQDIVNHHQSIVQNNKDCVVITSLKNVHEELESKGIVSEWLIPTQEDMIVLLERLFLSTTQRKQKEMQIIFGRIYIDDTAYLKKISSEKQLQLRNQNVQKNLSDFVDQFEGYLTILNDYEYLFVTNRGAFEWITEGYKVLPIIEEIKNDLNINLSIGIGFGENAFQAGRNSRLAVFQAKNYGGHCAFIVREDREVFGPIELIAPIKYPLSVTDQKLIEKAKAIGTSPTHLEKTLSMLKRKNYNKFSAHDMAEILSITTRSSHRILQTWLDAEIVKVVGIEKLTTRGRPRQIFSIKK